MAGPARSMTVGANRDEGGRTDPAATIDTPSLVPCKQNPAGFCTGFLVHVLVAIVVHGVSLIIQHGLHDGADVAGERVVRRLAGPYTVASNEQ